MQLLQSHCFSQGCHFTDIFMLKLLITTVLEVTKKSLIANGFISSCIAAAIFRGKKCKWKTVLRVSASYIQRDTQQIVLCMQEPNRLPGFTWGFLVHAVSLAETAQLMAGSCGITYKGGEKKQGYVRVQTSQEWFAVGKHTRPTFSSSEQITTFSSIWIPVFLSLSLHCLRGEEVIWDKKSTIFIFPKPCLPG